MDNIYNSGLRRSITMLVLGSAGTTLFLLPFLHEIYYEPMRLALDQTNVQIGSMSSAYGLASLLGYSTVSDQGLIFARFL
jgi:hypothetical protein